MTTDLDEDERAFFRDLLSGLHGALDASNLLDVKIPVRRQLIVDAVEAITDYITEAP